MGRKPKYTGHAGASATETRTVRLAVEHWAYLDALGAEVGGGHADALAHAVIAHAAARGIILPTSKEAHMLRSITEATTRLTPKRFTARDADGHLFLVAHTPGRLADPDTAEAWADMVAPVSLEQLTAVARGVVDPDDLDWHIPAEALDDVVVDAEGITATGATWVPSPHARFDMLHRARIQVDRLDDGTIIASRRRPRTPRRRARTFLAAWRLDDLDDAWRLAAGDEGGIEAIDPAEADRLIPAEPGEGYRSTWIAPMPCGEGWAEISLALHQRYHAGIE